MSKNTTNETREEHTPGPWEYYAQAKRVYARGPAEPVWTGGGIADIAEWDEEKYPGSGSPPANGRLIAAAPDLLEAAKLAIQNLSPLYTDDHIVMVKLREAIKKATRN